MSFNITQRQDVMGHPGRKVFDMRPQVRARGGGAMPFSGFAWVGNKPKITVNLADVGATNFLSIQLDGSGYDWVGSMPDSQPADAVVFQLDQTAGNIHIPGSIAPGG